MTLIGRHNFPGSNNWDRALFLFFALQRLDSPGMRLKPEQVASISAVCKGKDMKDVFVWLPTAFVKSVCYETTPFVAETTPFVAETILFVMDCKLRRIDSESGKYSSCSSSLVQYVTSSSTWIGNVICPSSSVLALDNYAHAQTVDTRPFFLGRVGPGNEAKSNQESHSFYYHNTTWNW